MANAAILVGNIEYHKLPKLECCRDDLLAIKQLLEAAEKYEEITIIENTEADPLKSQLRAAVDKVQSPEELLFYFTGHGHVHQDEFFHCATNFDARRPNETGISTTELHTLLKLVDAGLVVKLIDACYSGTLLVKGEWFPQNKDGFRNLISIASCLDSQTSLTGNPLSLFTEKFRAAALRKTGGPVFYTDIINTLRDEFIDNDSQTPFFVSQHTAREQFVDDATRLDALRKALTEIQTTANNQVQIAQQIVPVTMNLLERLAAADAKVVKSDVMANFVGTFFDNLIKKVSTSEFAEFFDHELTEHARFEESTAEEFIIRVMSKEKRADNFVTAKHTRKLRTPNPMVGSYSLLQGLGYLDNDMYKETWDLSLNCTMARTQLRITLTPKFTNLQRIVLVVTCAPSLDHCYIFEVATEHLLRDFGKYDADGPEASRRWWKVGWSETTDGIVAKIFSKFAETVRGQLESAEKRLSQG
jgi:caspase domain-containing protein